MSKPTTKGKPTKEIEKSLLESLVGDHGKLFLTNLSFIVITLASLIIILLLAFSPRDNNCISQVITGYFGIAGYLFGSKSKTE